MALNLKERFVNALLGTPVQVEGAPLITGYGDKIDEYANNLGNQDYMKPLLDQPKETGLSLDQYKQDFVQGLNHGNANIAKAQAELGIRTPQTMEEQEQARQGVFNQPTMLSMGTAKAPRQGGWINDFVGGYRENSTQGFEAENLAPDKNKSWATRFGEGLGTLARFYDKPIGRMAVATGLSYLTDEANPLREGVRAYVGRQTNMTKDKAYRQGLIKMGIDANEVNAIPGMMTDDIFSNIARAKQLQDDAEWKRKYFDAQQEQNKILNEIKEKELEMKQGKEAFDRWMAGQNLSIEEQKLALGYYKAQNQGKNKAGYQKFQTALSDNKLALKQVSDLKKAIQENPKALGLIVGSFAKGKETSQKIANEFISSDPNAIKTRAGVSKLRGTTMHDLAGTAQTLQEQRNLAPFLPDLTDSPETALAKLEQLEKELLREQNSFNVMGQDLGYFDNEGQDNDPLGIL